MLPTTPEQFFFRAPGKEVVSSTSTYIGGDPIRNVFGSIFGPWSLLVNLRVNRMGTAKTREPSVCLFSYRGNTPVEATVSKS